MKYIAHLSYLTNHGELINQTIPHSVSQLQTNGSQRLPSDMPPLCMGTIVEDNSSYCVNGVPVALNGMKTTCSAKLIASDSWASIHR